MIEIEYFRWEIDKDGICHKDRRTYIAKTAIEARNFMNSMRYKVNYFVEAYYCYDPEDNEWLNENVNLYAINKMKKCKPRGNRI